MLICWAIPSSHATRLSSFPRRGHLLLLKRWVGLVRWGQGVSQLGCLLIVGFQALEFSVTNSATLVAQHWEVFVHNVLPKGAYFDTFRQWIGYVNLDTDSSVSPPNGGTRNGIHF